MVAMFPRPSFFRTLACLGACAFLYAGCCNDPSWTGNAPYGPPDQWIPCKEPLYTIKNQSTPEDIDNLLKNDRPLSLCDLVDIALRNNPNTEKTWADARAAAYNWEMSKAPFYPTVTEQTSLEFIKQNFGSGSLASNSLNTTGVASSIVSGTGGAAGVASAATSSGPVYSQLVFHELTIEYLLFDFGGRMAEYESTRQALIAANWVHNRTIQTTINQVMTIFFTLQQTKALIEAQLEQLKDAQTSLDAAKGQYEAGVKTVVDFLLAKSNLINIQVQLESLRGQFETNKGQLAAVLGLKANTPLNLAPLPKDLPLEKTSKDIEELMDIALQERPDISAAYATYFQSEADLASAVSAWFPTITATGNFEKFNNIHVPASRGFASSGIITLNVPIFAGFLYENQIRRAEEVVRSTFAQLEIQVNQAMLDVLTSYYALKTAIETLKFADEYLKYSQEGYNAAYQSYKQGTGTILDLLTAQTQLANARAQRINAITSWVTSVSNLAYATGVLNDCELKGKL